MDSVICTSQWCTFSAVQTLCTVSSSFILLLLVPGGGGEPRGGSLGLELVGTKRFPKDED